MTNPMTKKPREWKGFAIMYNGAFVQLRERMGSVPWVLAIYDMKRAAQKEHKDLELDDEEIIPVKITLLKVKKHK